MKIRLHEIELGSGHVSESTRFYSDVLELASTVSKSELSVFNTGTSGLDFNISSHIDPGKVAVSFVTDDLKAVIKKLQNSNTQFRGPYNSHLGMESIEFNDPDGFLVRVNQPGVNSPDWLHV